MIFLEREFKFVFVKNDCRVGCGREEEGGRDGSDILEESVGCLEDICRCIIDLFLFTFI